MSIINHLAWLAESDVKELRFVGDRTVIDEADVFVNEGERVVRVRVSGSIVGGLTDDVGSCNEMTGVAGMIVVVVAVVLLADEVSAKAGVRPGAAGMIVVVVAVVLLADEVSAKAGVRPGAAGMIVVVVAVVLLAEEILA
jgi:hypothetical protein